MVKNRAVSLALFFFSVIATEGRASLRNVLHYHKCGYMCHPGGLSGCTAALDQLAGQFGFRVKHSDSSADLLHLRDYDLVIFDNTTDAGGAPDSTSPPQLALIDYMDSGGKLLGFHSATDDYVRPWGWYDSVLFSGAKVHGWEDGSGGFRLYKTALASSDTDRALADMWQYTRDSLQLNSDTVKMTTECLHFKADVRGKEGVKVIQEVEGCHVPGVTRQSHTWVKFFPGGGRVLYTGIGHEAADWTVNGAWLKKATYAYMRYLVGDFDTGPTALAPAIRALGSRLEIRTGSEGSFRVTDTRGRIVASGSGESIDGFVLKKGVYFVTTGKPGATVSKSIAIP